MYLEIAYTGLDFERCVWILYCSVWSGKVCGGLPDGRLQSRKWAGEDIRYAVNDDSSSTYGERSLSTPHTVFVQPL